MENYVDMGGAVANYGPALALLGAALAAGLGGIGSSIGSGKSTAAASGVMSEKPEAFGKLLILAVMPGSQGIYGLVVAAIVLFVTGIDVETTQAGAEILFSCMAFGLAGLFSGIYQGHVGAAATQIIAKQPDQFGKAMMYTAIVELFAMFGLLVTILSLFSI